MTKHARLVLVLGCTLILLAGCSSQPELAEEPPPAPLVEPEVEPVERSAPTPEVPAKSEPETVESKAPAPPETTETGSAPVEPPRPAPAPTEEPVAEPAPAKPAVEPVPEAEPTEPVAEEPAEDPPPPPPPPSPDGLPTGWAVVDIGGEVEVGATQEGLSRIGATKCKICHKVQYASWAESPHGTREPPLDCESCHGPGSAYKSKKVMEDPEAARAAGMVIPNRAFCEQCHTGGWTDDLLLRTHAHKEDGS